MRNIIIRMVNIPEVFIFIVKAGLILKSYRIKYPTHETENEFLIIAYSFLNHKRIRLYPDFAVK